MSDDKKNIVTGIAGELLKKAVSVGAGAYVSAEETVAKTLNTVQAPITLSKAVIREIIEDVLSNYKVSVKAEIDFIPKNRSSESTSKDGEQK